MKGVEAAAGPARLLLYCRAISGKTRRFPSGVAKQPRRVAKGRAAAGGWRGRGKDRLNQAPLFVGEVHRIFEYKIIEEQRRNK